MSLNSKDLVHEIYNDIHKYENSEFNDMLEILQKVFIRLDELDDKKDDSHYLIDW